MIFKHLKNSAAAILALCAAFVFLTGMTPANSDEISAVTDESANFEYADENSFIKWADFNVPFSALEKAMNMDINAHKEGKKLDWIELLSLTAARLYGNWRNYKSKLMDDTAQKMLAGESFSETKDGKTYKYYREVYEAVLANFVGEYTLLKDGERTEKYGLKAFYPIAGGFSASHYDDFGDSRNYGYRRRHLGHDMMGRIGTPIIAVEGGTIDEFGWNRYGGWRIGIRSFDKKRSYYYAHMRKGRPYAAGLKKGDTVKAGDVIGYMGMTGYSQKEDVNNIKVPHLHLGMQLIFDESQKQGPKEIWVDVYPLCKLLYRNRADVVRNQETKEYSRKYQTYTA